MTMSGTQTEAVLNKLTKPELVQLLLETEATLGSQIADLSKEIKDTLTYLKNFKADAAVVRTVNDRLVERVVKTERQCKENAQYSRQDTLEIIGIPNSIGSSVLEGTVRRVFKKIGVEIDERDIQVCHRLKEKERIVNKRIVPKSLGNLNPLTRQSQTFLRTLKFLLMKVYVLITEASGINAKNEGLFRKNGLIRVKLEETGPSKIITHMVDLKDLFPNMDIENL